jgi:NAD dependent epimerase/dehydratase family enzyme
MSEPKKTPRYQQLLQQEVTRKQFIQVMALAIVSILGFSNLLNLLTGAVKPAKVADASHGFGSNKFGV